MEEISIQKAQQLVDEWIHKYGVRYFSELTNMTVLTEEVGELARVMARKYGDQSFKPGESDNLSDEIKDLEKKTNRDKERHINNPKLK